jgi:hypothetical protein
VSAVVPQIRVVVVNHEHNAQAHELAQAFRPHAQTVAIDSGSRLTPAEEAWFDQRLPNVHYTGLWNAAVKACDDLADHDALYFICSDVSVPDAELAVARARRAFADPRIGIYGASATGSSFRTMHNQGTGGLRDLPFVDGFCFAARLFLLRAIAPVDTSVNALGWGLDVHLSLCARIVGLRCVIDDGVQVSHSFGSGYGHDEAKAQWHAWLATQPPAVSRGHRRIFHSFSETALGILLLRLTPWSLLYARGSALQQLRLPPELMDPSRRPAA